MIKINLNVLKKLLILPFLLFSIVLFSQNFKKEKRIYVLDLTGSMWGSGAGTDIFDEVRVGLIQTINALENPSTDISVITFGKDVIEIWNAEASVIGKQGLIKKINAIEPFNGQPIRQATNICAALEAAKKKLNPLKFNYLFLYTDGGHNFYNGASNNNLQCVRDIVAEICLKNNRTDDVYPFYIMLTKQASSQELKNSLACFTVYDNNCANPEIVIVRPEQNRYSINLLENKLSAEVKFISNKKTSLISDVNLKVTLKDNSAFTLKKTSYKLTAQLDPIIIEFTPKGNLELLKSNLPLKSELELIFEVNYLTGVGNCKTVEMRPDKAFIDVINRREKTVNISIN